MLKDERRGRARKSKMSKDERRGRETEISSSRLARLVSFCRTLTLLVKIHPKVFEKINCLDCGNCCKTAHPIFTKTDVARISDFVGMKISLFENQYLKSDADGDLVPNQLPCPFLNTDNTCQVYEVRPKSCRSFPHTHSKEGWERNNLLTKNTITCPAAFRIVEKMRTGRG